MANQTSVFKRLPEGELKQLISESKSFGDVFRKLKMARSGVQYSALRKLVIERGIDLSHFKGSYSDPNKFSTEIPIELTFIEDSDCASSHLSKKIRRHNLKEYKCVKCDNTGEWMGEKLSLHLDHINGDSRDNRLDNLRFLCPNCHSQTPTFAGRKLKKRYYCKTCAKEYAGYGKTCQQCSPANQIKIKYPEKEDLRILMWSKTINEAAKEIGCSFNGLKNHCKRSGIEIPTKGYWIRRRHGHSHEDSLKTIVHKKELPTPKKLTQEQATEVVAMLARKETLRVIAERFNVSLSCISGIRRGETYKDIPRPWKVTGGDLETPYAP